MKDIIVGVDTSTSSEHALDRALLEAERTGCNVRIVHAWTTPVWVGTAGMAGFAMPMPALKESRDFAQTIVEELLAKAMSRRGSDSVIEVTTQIEEGDPARVLSRLSTDASLLVIGGSGHGQLASALLGSATTYVLHHAACPVMVVAQSTQVQPFTRVVVGVDGSPSSRNALQWGLQAARSLNIPLVAVHAWLIHSAPGLMPYASPPVGATYEQDAQGWLDTQLSQAMPADSVSTVVRRVPYGHSAGALLDEAGPDDLLVVGSRGHGGFSSLLLGSVAIQTATHARGSVVVIRP